MAKKQVTEGEESKRFESKYNPTILKQLIAEGLNATQIMERIGIKHKQVLKQYIMRLCSDEKTYFEVPSLYVKSTTGRRQLLLGAEDNYSCAPTSAPAKQSSGVRSVLRALSWPRGCDNMFRF